MACSCCAHQQYTLKRHSRELELAAVILTRHLQQYLAYNSTIAGTALSMAYFCGTALIASPGIVLIVTYVFASADMMMLQCLLVIACIKQDAPVVLAEAAVSRWLHAMHIL